MQSKETKLEIAATLTDFVDTEKKIYSKHR